MVERGVPKPFQVVCKSREIMGKEQGWQGEQLEDSLEWRFRIKVDAGTVIEPIESDKWHAHVIESLSSRLPP